MLLGKLDICLQKTETETILSPCTNINSKWIKDLNIRPQTLKLVHERSGDTLEVIDIGKNFLSRTQAAQQLRERINKWDYEKLNSFCTTKEMVFKLKRPPTVWEKIVARYTSDRELKKLNSTKINDPIKKWPTELIRTFSKEEVQMAKKHMKKCSSSLAINKL
jgi:hypothetical protein